MAVPGQPRPLGTTKLAARLRQECGARAPDLARWLPVSVSLCGSSAGPPEPVCEGGGWEEDGETRGTNTPQSAHTLFLFHGGDAGLSRAGRGVAALTCPRPRTAPPPQVDGSSSWDCNGARSREPQAAAGTRWPGRTDAASSALRIPQPALQRSRSVSTSARLRTRYPPSPPPPPQPTARAGSLEGAEVCGPPPPPLNSVRQGGLGVYIWPDSGWRGDT